MTCPICDKPPSPRYRPFCSRRCADIDLGKWLTGSYAIPTDEDPRDEDAPPERRVEGDD
jgi:endogenous inhibitor of DNA gyrase (YacG/DUF329 family)